MRKVKFDIQAFQRMEYGGIPSYFIELARHINLQDPSEFRVVQDGMLTSNADLRANSFFPIYFNSRLVRPVAKFVNPRISRIKDYDLIHSTYYHESFLKKIPVNRHIVTIHDMIPEDFPEHFGGSNPHQAKSKYLHKSSAVICVSEYTKNRLLVHFPWLDKDSVFVVHHGSKFKSTKKDVSARSSRRKSKSSSKTFRILYVGSRLGYKNFQVLLKAGNLLVNNGLKFEIICVGGGLFSESEVEQIHDYGLKDAMHQIKASGSELEKLYLSSDCHITTSLAEGFGLPLLEAMSLGCPTIISSAEALQEVSGGSSLVFKPSDHSELANHIRSLAESLELADHKAELGLLRSRKFNWDSTATQTIAIYNHVLETCQ